MNRSFLFLFFLLLSLSLQGNSPITKQKSPSSVLSVFFLHPFFHKLFTNSYIEKKKKKAPVQLKKYCLEIQNFSVKLQICKNSKQRPRRKIFPVARDSLFLSSIPLLICELPDRRFSKNSTENISSW